MIYQLIVVLSQTSPEEKQKIWAFHVKRLLGRTAEDKPLMRFWP
jgi:hypothetical protein